MHPRFDENSIVCSVLFTFITKGEKGNRIKSGTASNQCLCIWTQHSFHPQFFSLSLSVLELHHVTKERNGNWKGWADSKSESGRTIELRTQLLSEDPFHSLPFRTSVLYCSQKWIDSPNWLPLSHPHFVSNFRFWKSFSQNHSVLPPSFWNYQPNQQGFIFNPRFHLNIDHFSSFFHNLILPSLNVPDFNVHVPNPIWKLPFIIRFDLCKKIYIFLSFFFGFLFLPFLFDSLSFCAIIILMVKMSDESGIYSPLSLSLSLSFLNLKRRRKKKEEERKKKVNKVSRNLFLRWNEGC